MNERTAGESDDRVWVAEFLDRRSETAFRALYRCHAPALYRLAYRMLGGVEKDAEDAVQEAWLRATVRLDGFEWRSSLRTWLTGLTLNCCRELIRRRARQPSFDGDPVDRPGLSVVPRSGGTDLERAIAALPEGYRTVLLLHDVEGYTHREIAALLGVEPGTSKSQLFQARKALRQRLATVEDPETQGGDRDVRRA